MRLRGIFLLENADMVTIISSILHTISKSAQFCKQN